MAQAGATVSAASRAIPLIDLMANQKFNLALQQMQGQYGIGQASLESQLRHMILSDRTGTLNQLLSLI